MKGQPITVLNQAAGLSYYDINQITVFEKRHSEWLDFIRNLKRADPGTSPLELPPIPDDHFAPLIPVGGLEGGNLEAPVAM